MMTEIEIKKQVTTTEFVQFVPKEFHKAKLRTPLLFVRLNENARINGVEYVAGTILIKLTNDLIPLPKFEFPKYFECIEHDWEEQAEGPGRDYPGRHCSQCNRSQWNNNGSWID